MPMRRRDMASSAEATRRLADAYKAAYGEEDPEAKRTARLAGDLARAARDDKKHGGPLQYAPDTLTGHPMGGDKNGMGDSFSLF